MTDSTKKLQNVKQEIRSVLLPQSRGLNLPSFMKEYKMMVGENVPFRELGYGSPEDFIKSLKDVVDISWSQRAGTYILKAIADESTKHIEKLVSKQKTGKANNPLRKPNSSGLPPRLKFTSNFRNTSSHVSMPAYIKKEVIDVLGNYVDGLSISNFLVAYKRQFGKELNFSNYGFHAVEDFLNTIPELVLKSSNGENKVFVARYLNNQGNMKKIRVEGLYARNGNVQERNNVMNTVPASKNHTLARNGIPQAVNMNQRNLERVNGSLCLSIDSSTKFQFQKILKEYPEGLYASAFVKIYERRSGKKLDISKYGHCNLIDLLDSMPDIFKVERPPGCTDDWLLLDASQNLTNASRDIPLIKETFPEVQKNVLDLLKSRPAGIDLDDFKDSYERMFKRSLNLPALGFESLRSFLAEMDSFVPLILEVSKSNPGKTVCYIDQRTTLPHTLPVPSFHIEPKSQIPADAVLSDEKYSTQTLPSSADLSQYVGVFVLNVQGPNLMHIQFRREDTSVALECLMDELENFYFGEHSFDYKMPDSYVMKGAACVGVWPCDGHWHRICITSIPSTDSVFAEFVDYGTRQRISKKEIRFLKKEFMTLPAQAVKARLSHIMPINGVSWDSNVQQRILELTNKKPLMAQIDNTSFEGFLSLSLCDTNGVDDVHINDVLVKEGYAQYCVDKNNQQFPLPSVELQSLGERFSVPQEHDTFGSNGSGLTHTTLLNGFQENNSSTKNMLNNTTRSGDAICTAYNSFVSDALVTSSVDPSIMHRFLCSSPSNSYKNDESFQHEMSLNFPYNNIEHQPSFMCNSVSETDNNRRFSITDVNLNMNHSGSSDNTSDIFEDEEEVYESFCHEANSPVQRRVKRIALSDGFPEVHMILVENRPYISSGDLTYLLWGSEDPDCVERRLRMKEISVLMITLHEIKNQKLFMQLQRLGVRGIKVANTVYNGSITLFPFKNIIDILNIFGHPSIAVREEIEHETLEFNPEDPFWRAPFENEVSEREISRDTYNQRKPCLTDLKATLQALKFQRQQLKNKYSNQNDLDVATKIKKIESQCEEVENNIRILQQTVISYAKEKGYRN